MEQRKGSKRKRSEDGPAVRVPSTLSRPPPITPRPSAGVVPALHVEGFKHGAVLSMKLHNFLTFDDVDFYPSPYLNVVVAPNGTGKSSLVCGLCLGLAGSQKLLGRAREMKDFVKHGKEEAFIEIQLFQSNGNPVRIRRSFHRRDNHSKWFVNGRDKLEKDVVKIVSECHIQLENKCQFLPQDIVVEFAKLNIYSLLEETERAIGPHDMLENHNKLKSLKQEKSGIQSQLNDKKEELQRLRQRNQLVERDVQRIHNRRACLERVNNLTIKKVWLEYDDARQRFDDVRKERKSVEKQLRDLKRVHAPLRLKLQENEAIVTKFRDTERNLGQSIAGVVQKITVKQNELVSQQDCIEEARRDFEKAKQDEEKRLSKQQQMQNEIEEFKSELSSLEPAERIQPLIADKNARIHQLRDQMGLLQNRQQTILDNKDQHAAKARRAQNQLTEMDDVRNQRLELLCKRDRETWQAIKWLRENKDRFRETVFEPILVLLNVTDSRYAALVEDCFSGRDFFSFVAQNKADHELFMSEVRDKLNLRIHAVRSPSNDLSSYRCPMSHDQLRQWGFSAWVMDLVEAPAPVLAYFCHFHKLHTVPIADQLTERQVDAFTNGQNQIQKFYTGNMRYFAKRSRFRDKVITTSSQVNRCQFLVSSVDESFKAALLADINEAKQSISDCEKQIEELRSQELALRQQDGQLRKDKNKLQETVNTRRRLNTAIKSKTLQLSNLQNSPMDLEAEESKMKDSIKISQDKRMKILEKLAQLSQGYSGHLVAKVKARLNLVQAEKRKEYLHTRFQSSTDELKAAELAVTKGKADEDRAKDQARQLMERARRKSGYSSPNDFTEELANILVSLPASLSDIDEAIHENATQADVLMDPNEDTGQVLRDFESREKTIERLDKDIKDHETRLRSHSERTSELKERWLTPLKELMNRVSERFSTSFSQMGCAGEVSLLEDPDDFSKYGVQIRVKFRDDDDLHVLDAHRQSGGERSVSTMLYLMALQDITSCPFRVVDEINQGMDSKNERRVFDLIVDTVSSADTSQYFLLTPKLLQGLKYTPQVKVHCIHNGAEAPPSAQWVNSSRFLE